MNEIERILRLNNKLYLPPLFIMIYEINPITFIYNFGLQTFSVGDSETAPPPPL